MAHEKLPHMDTTESRSFAARLADLLKNEQHAMADFLVALAEFDRQRAWLALGYSGWSTGQLDEEFRRGVWLPAPIDPSVVFETEPENRWERVLRDLGIEPGRIVNPARDLN